MGHAAASPDAPNPDSRHPDAAELSVWLRPEPGRRRPRYTRDDLARAAVHIADTEGIEAVSMRRVAAELGAGTMTLYHYVTTKNELFTLMTDAVVSENIVPDAEMPTEWRAAVTAIALRTRAALRRHPWVFDIVDRPGIGPNGVRHFDQSLGALDDLGLDLTDRLDVIGVVDEYVFGFCLRERELFQPRDADNSTFDGLLKYLFTLVESGDFPNLRTLVDQHGMRAVWGQIEAHNTDAGRFERNLARLLDGIERDIFRR